MLSIPWEGAAKYGASPVQRYANLESSHHKFTGCVANADEIHALWQVGNIDLLGFLTDGARHQGLAHQVGDSE